MQAAPFLSNIFAISKPLKFEIFLSYTRFKIIKRFNGTKTDHPVEAPPPPPPIQLAVLFSLNNFILLLFIFHIISFI